MINLFIFFVLESSIRCLAVEKNANDSKIWHFVQKKWVNEIQIVILLAPFLFFKSKIISQRHTMADKAISPRNKHSKSSSNSSPTPKKSSQHSSPFGSQKSSRESSPTPSPKPKTLKNPIFDYIALIFACFTASCLYLAIYITIHRKNLQSSFLETMNPDDYQKSVKALMIVFWVLSTIFSFSLFSVLFYSR